MSTTALEALVSRMPLSELADRSGRSVEEIVGWAMGGASVPAKRVSTRAAAPAPAPSPEAPRKGGGSKAVNTRTPEGRGRYDSSVLDLVRQSSGPIAAATIRKQAGGTALQVRAALNRLIEAGQVEYQGRARATRYTAS